ncbi:unnamed protein product [Symbiodinium sp. CCMP2592]|nr:unnamed protein product [Symbiodinium sp. CCMP2592]
MDLVQSSFFSIVGWVISAEKECGFNTFPKVLGVQISLADSHAGLVTVHNTEAHKRVHLVDVPEGSATLRIQPVLWESCFLPFACALKYCLCQSCVKLGAQLKESLTFLRERVVLGKPRVAHADFRPVYRMYSDASYDASSSGGGLGGIAYDFTGLCIGWFGEHVSQVVLQGINPEGKKTLIYELEALAAVLGCELLLSTLRQCDIVLFTDNEGGSSDCPFVQCAPNRLFDLEEDRSLNVWFERVCSASNPADAPSRGSYLLPDFLRHHSSVSRVLSEFCASSTGATALDSSALPTM